MTSLNITGRRLPDCPITNLPGDIDDLQPGDYWLVMSRDGHRLLNVRDHPEDRLYWGGGVNGYWDENLTGLVLGVYDPLRYYGMLSIHTVRLEEDETVSVRPGDGSSNSILIKRREDEPWWHGYIEHGVWTGQIENE